MGNNDNKDDCCSDEDMMIRKWRRTRITVGTDEDEDKDGYCFHEVMMMMRRWRRRTTTRTDYNIEYCCEEEKEDNEEKDMDVCMVPIGQYINHCTRPDTV